MKSTRLLKTALFLALLGIATSQTALATDKGFELRICEGSPKPELLAGLRKLDDGSTEPLDNSHVQAFKQLLSSYGWPTYSCTGVSGIDMAGRLLYRASTDHNFQLAVLRGMDPQVGVDVDPYHFANLWDAVSLQYDGSQTYGTIIAAEASGKLHPVGTLKNESSRLFFRDFYGLPPYSPHHLGSADAGIGYAHSGWDGRLGRPQPTYSEPGLRDLLGEMISKDQQARMDAIQAEGDERKRLMHDVAAIDADNLVKLKKIFAEHGFPDVGMVGRDGVSTVFLLVQHADSDPALQKQALALARPLMLSRQLSRQQYAYLVDRVLLAQGKKQLYGTQVSIKGGKPSPLPVEDAAHLDSRRLSMSLGPESDYLDQIEAQYSQH